MVSSYVKGSDVILRFLGCAVSCRSCLWRTHGKCTLPRTVTGFVPLPEGFFVTVNQNKQGFADSQAASTFWDSVSLHLKWVGLIWVCGLSVIGLPGILVLNFLKGVLIGFSVGYMVGQYSWKGLLFSLVSVAPHNLLVIPILLVCSVAAMTFSIHMIKTKILATRPSDGMLRPLLSYAGLTAVMMVLLIGSASFETWVTPVMMQWVTPMLTASVTS